MRALAAHLDHRRVGTLIEDDGLWHFEYDAAWTGAADAFDLSPQLPRSQAVHRDGATERPVQWYFDNLLPEEQLREAVSREAAIPGEDAFALLAYLGAESAGSLVLIPPGQDPVEPGGLLPLGDEGLSERIRQLPRRTLSSAAPKRMSVAGTQNKLLVVCRDGALFEPVGSEPSTHLLKPDHLSDDYPASAMNEYLVMTLAARVGLRVPPVQRRYTPEAVYIVERYDRWADEAGRTHRRHIVDACQLLGKSRLFKYRAATLDTLTELVLHCRNRASTRLRLFQWLVFNLLVGNHDNHLKNLSFMVSAEGIELAPAYDLLSTAAYHTRAFANERANWPAVPLAIALPGADHFEQLSREAVLRAGQVLGLTSRIAERELGRIAAALPGSLDALVHQIEAENAALPSPVHLALGRELRLARTIQHIIVPEMLKRVQPGS